MEIAKLAEVFNMLLSKIQEIEKDCLQLKKEKQLTEYGEGELHIIQLIKKIYPIKINIQ